MQEEKKKHTPEIVCIAFVGHTQVENISEIKNYIKKHPALRPVFFKVSFDKLWISDSKDGGGSR